MKPARREEDEEAAGAGLDGYRLDDQVGYLLRLANQRHTALFQERTLEGLTPTQFAVLARLAERGPMSQNRLGRAVGMDAATVKGVVDRLRARDLVTAAADPNDARRIILGLTGRGRSLLSRMLPVARGITAATLAPLTAEERSTLVRLLAKIT